jgi:hypothetical protein
MSLIVSNLSAKNLDFKLNFVKTLSTSANSFENKSEFDLESNSNNANRTFGDLSITTQLLFGKTNLKFGAEIGYLKLYCNNINSNESITTVSIPILAIVDYKFLDRKYIDLHIESGIGITNNFKYKTKRNISRQLNYGNGIGKAFKLGIYSEFLNSFMIGVNYYLINTFEAYKSNLENNLINTLNLSIGIKL